MKSSTRTKALIVLLTATSLIAVSLLIAVARGKQMAEDGWNELYELAAHPHPGMYVPMYDGLTSFGDSARLGVVRPESRQLLYFFTTTCPYCRASIPEWKTLHQLVASRPDVEVFGVALDSTHLIEAYLAEHDLPYPVVEMNDPRFARLFRVSGVPLTMIVQPGGQVGYARRGEFTSLVLDSVRAVLDAPFPEPLEVPLGVPSVREAVSPR